MGMLNGLGQSMASSVGGINPTAGGLAQNSLGWGAANTLLSSAGALTEGLGNAAAMNYSANQARLNNQAALSAGQEQESASKMKFGSMVAAQKAGFAGQNVGVSGENVRGVTTTTQNIGAIDAALIHYNAMREAFGDKALESEEKKAETGDILAGIYKAGSSFLGGASSLSGKWLGYQQSFGPGGPVPSFG